MKNPRNNPHKQFVVFGCGLFAGFVPLPAGPAKRQILDGILKRTLS